MRNRVTLMMLAFVFLVSISYLAPQRNLIEIYFLDVGQGDAIVVSISGFSPIIIDGGPTNEVFLPKKTILTDLGCEISKMILTHPHSDHLFGLTRLLQICKVVNLYFNAIDYDSKNYLDFKKLARSVPNQPLYKGDVFKFGKVSFYVLWPPKEMIISDHFSDLNNSSVVLLLDYGNFEALLTGDIDKSIQNRLNLDKYDDVIDGYLDVYKVPHHGSKGSFDSRFLLSLKPKVAVVSVGENSYGHPSQKFVDFFLENDIAFYRTDRDGDIIVRVRQTL